MFNVFPILPI